MNHDRRFFFNGLLEEAAGLVMNGGKRGGRPALPPDQLRVAHHQAGPNNRLLFQLKSSRFAPELTESALQRAEVE